MRILLVSTLKRSVTATNFASRSRVIFQLAQGLVKRGHQVSLLGTQDSVIPGVTIIPVIEKSWENLPPVENPYLRETATLIELTRKIIEIQDDFDIVHNHTYPDFFPLVVENELTTPFCTTMYAVYDSYLDELLSKYRKTHFISLSKNYQRLFQKGKIENVIHAGVDTEVYTYNEGKSDYAFWLGRLPKGKNKDGTFIDPKGVRHAIQLAQKSGCKLFLSGVVEDIEFFNIEVKPYLNDKIQWIGEVSHKQSLPIETIVKLFQNAKVFLMTINQNEPFGLVMAEAMACGTPVIAFDRGSVRELIVHGKTGFVVNPDHGIDGLLNAFKLIDTIDPKNCQDHVKRNFSIEYMIENYEKFYLKILNSHK